MILGYEKTISKMVNQSYFSKIFENYNSWSLKLEAKDSFLKCLLLTGKSLLIISIFLSILGMNKFTITLFILGLIITVLSKTVNYFNLLSVNDHKQIRTIQKDFLKELKTDCSILNDLSKLAIDDTSKKLFFSLADIVRVGEVNSVDFNFNTLKELFNHNYAYLINKEVDDKRYIWLKNMEIKLVKDEDSEIKESSYKNPNKQKLLEML